MTSASSPGPFVRPWRLDWVYLLQGTATTLLFAYLILWGGGTSSGLFSPRLRVCSHLILTLVLVAWLGSAVWRKRGIARSGLGIVFLLAFVALGITTLLSSDPRRSLGGLGLLVLYALWFYLVFDLVRQGWPPDVVVKSLLIVGAVVIVLGLWEASDWFGAWATTLSEGTLAIPKSIRISSVLDHANVLGSFLVLLLPLALSQLICARRWFSKVILLIWVAGNLLAQFLTSSRGGWLGAAVSLGLLLILLSITPTRTGRSRVGHWWRYWRERWWLMLLSMLLVVLALVAGGYLINAQMQHPSHGSQLWSRVAFADTAWDAFVGSPWHGRGPFTFSTEWLKRHPVPRFYKHAHNVALTVLAEGGILGLVALLLFVAAVVRALWLAWRRATPSQRLFMAGGIAALAGFCVHSLFDDFTARPAVMMAMVAILAVTLATSRSREVAPAGAALHPVLLIVPAALLVVGSFWFDWALATFDNGVNLSRAGKWEEAALAMDRAVSQDPLMAFYHLQRGYAWGTVAFDGGNEQALQTAIEAYERGVQLEPYYHLNHLNMFALYWQAGRREESLEEFRLALELARYGLWDTGQNEYGSQVFWRRGIRPDFLPQLKGLQANVEGIITEAQLDWFAELAQRYAVLEREGSTGQATTPLGAFTNGILLLGMERRPDEARPGERVEVLLTWLLSRPLPAVDYTVFAHLRDSQGRNVAQSDMRLVWVEDIPTAYSDGLLTTWRGALDLPSDIAPGDYDLKVGLYDLATMERAGVVDDASGENTVDVGSLTVVEP